MKRLNKKILTFLLAGACAASLCAATINVVSSAEEAEGIALSSIFTAASTEGATVDVETAEGAEKGTARFTLGNEKSAYLKRDLALKWYEDVDGTVTEKYLDMKFSFAKKEDFKKVTLKMESASSVVTEEDKQVNEVSFAVVDGDKLSISVNGGTATEISYADKATLSLQLGKAKAQGASGLEEDDSFGSFGVYVNETWVGNFVNVGANYADYAASKTLPLSFVAETEGDKQAVVLFEELNGQKFNEIKGDMITDTAAPVLVVNEEISGFQYGTAFSLSYEKIDVLQDSPTEKMYYYQWNPADEEVNYDKTLSTTTYFMDTVYYKDGEDKAYKTQNEDKTLTATSVRAEDANAREYVSVKVTLTDKKNLAKDYYLSWYANASAKATKELTKEGETKSTEYIIIDKNEDGAEYSYVVADGGENKYAENGVVGDATAQERAKEKFDGEIAEYTKLLTEAADGIKASSDASIKLPALDWLIKDNGGYRGLRFTVSYKTPSSTEVKAASNLQYNGLKFSISEEGEYEFKVYANDLAGNTMKYYLDGELVELNSNNVWDIEEIPSFSFVIKDAPVSVKEASKNTDKKAENILDSTYTLSGITVQGATNIKSQQALYRFDTKDYDRQIAEDTLLKVTYADVINVASASFDKVGKGKTYESYLDLYVHAYATRLAELLAQGTPTDEEVKAIENCFVKINEYNAKITEENDKAAWDAHNRFEWDAESKSFRGAEEGNYFIFADYYEDYLPSQRAAAYKMVIIESKADVIKGESQFAAWIKNNLVSVVLFGVAGVLLIAIIILLLVQPSDETLEDVDAAAAKKKAEKKKKDKK